MWKWGVSIAAGLAIVAGLLAFEPWRAFTNSTVNEPVPTVANGPVEQPIVTRKNSAPQPEPQPEAQREPAELAAGAFEDAEHDTEGTARIIELADGSRFLRLEDLATSDGPDLHVWLSDAASGGSWGSYDDGSHVRLGELKANNGNQNYPIPADADLAGMASVVIWCDRFNVAFGTAPVEL